MTLDITVYKVGDTLFPSKDLKELIRATTGEPASSAYTIAEKGFRNRQVVQHYDTKITTDAVTGEIVSKHTETWTETLEPKPLRLINGNGINKRVTLYWFEIDNFTPSSAYEGIKAEAVKVKKGKVTVQATIDVSKATEVFKKLGLNPKDFIIYRR